MRTVSIGFLGLVGGLLVGLLAQDLLALTLLDEGRVAGSLPLALIMGSLMPVCALTGITVALLVDRRRRRFKELSG